MATKLDMSPEAKKILHHLGTMEIGDVVTFKFLLNLTGINDVATLRARFYTAMRHAFKLWQMRFGPVRGVGYERLSEAGKTTEVSRRIRGVRRSVGRSIKYQRAVDIAQLNPLGRLESVVNTVQLSEMKKAVSRKKRNQLAKTNTASNLSPEQANAIVDAFRRQRK